MTAIEKINYVLENGNPDDKVLTAFTDFASKVQNGGELKPRQAAWVEREYNTALIVRKEPGGRAKKAHVCDKEFTPRVPAGPVVLNCGPLPLHPPGRPGNAPRFGR